MAMLRYNLFAVDVLDQQHVWMVGFNYKPNPFLAVKFNVRFRENLSPLPFSPSSETLYEVGLGIEF